MSNIYVKLRERIRWLSEKKPQRFVITLKSTQIVIHVMVGTNKKKLQHGLSNQGKPRHEIGVLDFIIFKQRCGNLKEP